MPQCEAWDGRTELASVLFLFLYVGQSAFNVCVERLNLIHSLRRADKAPAGFEEFIDESKLARASEYARAKTRVGILDEIVSDVTLLMILLSGLCPLSSFGLISSGCR